MKKAGCCFSNPAFFIRWVCGKKQVKSSMRFEELATGGQLIELFGDRVES